MNLQEPKLIGTYYVSLKKVHIEWTHNTGPKRKLEAYIPIPAKYSYAYEIYKGTVYTCTYIGTHDTVELKAAGTQSRHQYAKQFQGNNNLRIVYDLYKRYSAEENDYIVVWVYDNNSIQIEIIKKEDFQRIRELGLSGQNGKPILTDDVYVPYSEVGFRLFSLKVRKSSNILCDYQFFADGQFLTTDEPMSSLMIGANGAGKSFAMNILSELFLMVQNGTVKEDLPYDFCEVKYILNRKFVEIAIVNKTIVIHCDGVLMDMPCTSILPSKVLTIAFMLNDKFAFQREDSCESEGMYEYLGIRTASNAAWINTFNERVIQNILTLASEQRLWHLLKEVSSYLQIDPKITIRLELQLSNNAFDELLKDSDECIGEFLKKREEKLSQNRMYRTNITEKTNYTALAVYLRGLEEQEVFLPDTVRRTYGFTFDDKSSLSAIREVQTDYRYIEDLIRLRVIRRPCLMLYKNGTEYSFADSSSGEKNIVFTILNIACYLKKDSLVLIDEPEISLHPNWQMLYISFLKRIFKEYSSCHFLIASHSPYLVSDLNPKSSSLIILKNQNGSRTSETLNYSTYAWSTENILYNVFQVRTTRNFYFEMDIRELLSLMSNARPLDLAKIKELYYKLTQFVFDEHDPLNLILEQAMEYIKNAESNQTS